MGKKLVNENTTVVDLRKKAPQPKDEEKGKEGPIAIEPPETQDGTKADTVTGNPAIAAPKPRAKLSRAFRYKKTLIGLLVVALVAVGLGVSLKISNARNQAQLDCSKKTCRDILTQANTAITNRNTEQEKAVVKKITSIKNYNRQPNYMYVLTQYYIDLGDYNKAKDSLQKLSAVYHDGDYVPEISSVVLPPSTLELSVNTIKLNNDQVEKNSYQLTQPKN